MKTWMAAAVLAVMLCGASPGFAQSQPAVSEWQVPFLNCLTGPIASIGAYLQWGAERAAWEINQAGGIAGKPVKLTGIDTANDPQKGTVEMARIVFLHHRDSRDPIRLGSQTQRDPHIHPGAMLCRTN